MSTDSGSLVMVLVAIVLLLTNPVYGLLYLFLAPLAVIRQSVP